jgi:hypothetical protein
MLLTYESKDDLNHPQQHQLCVMYFLGRTFLPVCLFYLAASLDCEMFTKSNISEVVEFVVN